MTEDRYLTWHNDGGRSLCLEIMIMISFQDKVDIFIVAHLMGYWCKTLIFRDWWLTTVISIMFEFLEYR